MLKNWIANIALALVGSAILIWLIFIALNAYTRHNVEVSVPNLKGMLFEEAVAKLDETGLRYEISDSIYTKEIKRDGITDQNPAAGEKVKPNRVIYLTVNSLPKPRVKMPKVTDRSLNLAKALLANSGLELGQITTVYDEIGHNLVISQKHRGREIEPNEWVDKGSKIDLVVSTNRRKVEDPESGDANDE